MLALETVNSNVVDVTPRCRSRSLPKFTKGHRRKCLSSGLKEIGSNWVDEACHVTVMIRIIARSKAMCGAKTDAVYTWLHPAKIAEPSKVFSLWA